MNLCKPLVVVHPDIYACNPQFYVNLRYSFNVYIYSKKDLESDVVYHFVRSKSGSDEYKKLYNVEMKTKLYKQDIENDSLQSGTQYTSGKLKVKSTAELPKGPRLIIWPNYLKLTISGTWIYRCNTNEQPPDYIFEPLRNFKYNKSGNCIIFDLDNTLINDDLTIIPYALEMVKLAKSSYDYTVLWSHGSGLHVIENLINVDLLFDLVIYRNESTKNAPKNPFYLYTLVNDFLFTSFTLVDDIAENATDGYNCVLVPNKSTDARLLLKILTTIHTQRTIHYD